MKMPYYYSPGGFWMPSPKEHLFDYVVAIDYNRYRGTSPLDMRRPQPEVPDGGIWFHVGGAGPTRGCISVGILQMKLALTWLDQKMNPIMVMGPGAVLDR